MGINPEHDLWVLMNGPMKGIFVSKLKSYKAKVYKEVEEEITKYLESQSWTKEEIGWYINKMLYKKEL